MRRENYLLMFIAWLKHVLYLAMVVQRLDSVIHQINMYSVDGAINFPNTYSLDNELSSA